MQYMLPLALMLIPAVGVIAGDRPPPAHSRRLHATASHYGDSYWAPIDEDDTVFVSDVGFGLDTGCSYRSEGPLRIHLYVGRYVGPVRQDGFLVNPKDLIARRLLSPMAHLRLPVYDVDVYGDPTDPTVPPEVDHVYFNGNLVGTLGGDNEIWKLNEFDLPIEWIKFPARGAAPGLPPDPADNVIEIRIDEASGGQENWCTSADWAQLDFSAIAPILLVHGTAAKSSTWEPSFTTFFSDSHAPWSNDINLSPNGAILDNARQLSESVGLIAQMFGAKKCHIVAHSKGGLDTRAYLYKHYDPATVKVLSVYTLSTPHRGTVLADIAVARREATKPESSNPDLQTVLQTDYWLDVAGIFSYKVPQGDASDDQTTYAMAHFNNRFPGVPPKANILFYNFGADADLNHNGTIEHDSTREKDETADADQTVFSPARATAVYKTLGTAASIRITLGKRPGRLWGENTFTDISIASSTTSFEVNDLITTATSAQSLGGVNLSQTPLSANHFSIKSSTLASTILQHILADFPNN